MTLKFRSGITHPSNLRPLKSMEHIGPSFVAVSTGLSLFTSAANPETDKVR